MEHCILCNGEVEQGLCRACGRLQSTTPASAPAGSQYGTPSVPIAPSYPSAGLKAAPVRGMGKASAQGLRTKLLGTTRGKVITAILVIAMVAIGGVSAIVAVKGGMPSATGLQATTPTSIPQSAVIITEFPLPTANSSLAGITLGPDGNLWFTEDCTNTSSGCIKGKIGRITPDGTVTEFPLPVPSSEPGSIITGPDGNLWFNESANDSIGRITTTGQLTEFPLPNPNNSLGGIIVGPDSNLWFTDGPFRTLDRSSGSHIGRMTLSGKITEFPLPNANSTPAAITVGPKGTLWFTNYVYNSSTCDYSNSKIGRITSGK